MTDNIELQDIREMLIKHIAAQESRDLKIDQLYQKIVVGNGVPSLIEMVRKHEDWIEKEKVRREKWNWLIIGALAANIIALFFEHFYFP